MSLMTKEDVIALCEEALDYLEEYPWREGKEKANVAVLNLHEIRASLVNGEVLL